MLAPRKQKYYRAPALRISSKAIYTGAVENIDKMITNLSNIKTALNMVNAMRSDDAEFDTSVYNIAEKVNITSLDNFNDSVLHIQDLIHTAGTELNARRESYLLGREYARIFNIEDVSMLPAEVRSLICEYIGLGKVELVCTISITDNVELYQMCNIMSKKKLMKVIEFMKKTITSIDRPPAPVLPAALMQQAGAFGFGAPAAPMQQAGAFGFGAPVAPAAPMQQAGAFGVPGPQFTAFGFGRRLISSNVVDTNGILYFRFPEETELKSNICNQIQNVFDGIVSNYNTFSEKTKTHFLLNMRKLAVIFRTMLSVYRKKRRRRFSKTTPSFGKMQWHKISLQPLRINPLGGWLRGKSTIRPRSGFGR